MKYAYRVYKNGALNQPVYGGTVTANNMEQAAQQVIKRHSIKAIHEQYNGYKYDHFELADGRKVGILVYVNPEEF